MTTVMMMMTSAKSISPWMAPVTALMTAAAMSMMTMGSAICWKNLIHSGVLACSLSLFGPFLARRASASPELRPSSWLEPSWPSTSLALDRYSLT